MSHEAQISLPLLFWPCNLQQGIKWRGVSSTTHYQNLPRLEWKGGDNSYCKCNKYSSDTSSSSSNNSNKSSISSNMSRLYIWIMIPDFFLKVIAWLKNHNIGTQEILVHLITSECCTNISCVPILWFFNQAITFKKKSGIIIQI